MNRKHKCCLRQIRIRKHVTICFSSLSCTFIISKSVILTFSLAYRCILTIMERFRWKGLKMWKKPQRLWVVQESWNLGEHLGAKCECWLQNSSAGNAGRKISTKPGKRDALQKNEKGKNLQLRTSEGPRRIFHFEFVMLHRLLETHNRGLYFPLTA